MKQQSGLKWIIINKVPSEAEFPAEFNWTAGLIGKYIEREYGYNYSIRGITGMIDPVWDFHILALPMYLPRQTNKIHSGV